VTLTTHLQTIRHAAFTDALANGPAQTFVDLDSRRVCRNGRTKRHRVVAKPDSGSNIRRFPLGSVDIGGPRAR
jgi:hypothetical protein